MKRIGLIAVLLSLGCNLDLTTLADGGIGSKTDFSRIAVTNKYAVSIFTVTATCIGADGGASPSVTVFDKERIEAGDTERRDQSVTKAMGPYCNFYIDAVSLGTSHTISYAGEQMEYSDRALTFVYDYDLATANFVFSKGWH